MNATQVRRLGGACRTFALMLPVSVSAAAFPVLAQDKIDPEASRILAAMSENLKSMPVLSVDYEADQEVVDLQGQKIQYSASGSIAVDRAKGFHLKRMGPFSQSEVVFDGTTISLRDTMRNIYAQLPSPGHTVDDATEELRAATGLDAPGADFLANDPYRLLMDGVTEGVLVGSGFVGGVECDHLAFRTDLVDWQIWINKSGRPLPLKYVITTKWTTGAPQYTLRLNNWSAAAVDAALFTFAVPKDGTRVDRVQADATGDVSVEVAQ